MKCLCCVTGPKILDLSVTENSLLVGACLAGAIMSRIARNGGCGKRNNVKEHVCIS